MGAMDNIGSTLIYALRENRQDRTELDIQEEGLIRALRDNNVTWQEIADVYDISRQAVHSKWAEKVKTVKTEVTNGSV